MYIQTPMNCHHFSHCYFDYELNNTAIVFVTFYIVEIRLYEFIST